MNLVDSSAAVEFRRCYKNQTGAKPTATDKKNEKEKLLNGPASRYSLQREAPEEPGQTKSQNIYNTEVETIVYKTTG